MIVADDVLGRGVELFGVDQGALRHLGGVDGAVYACAREGQASVIKFVPMPAEQIPAAQAKLDFAYYLALHGVSVASTGAMVRSRLLPSDRVAMMAGTLQPPAVIRGMIARPCSPTRCMIRSVRNAAAFM